MSRSQFFVIGSSVIFLLERTLPALTSWPLFIFPVFAILFMLISRNNAADLLYVVIVSIFFDLFSGYSLGFFTITILAIAFAIFIFKTLFNVSPQSLFLLVIYTLIFTFAYFAIISINSSSRLLIDQAYAVIAEAILVFIMFNLIFRKVKN